MPQCIPLVLAYIDPASGSIILQALIASVIGAAAIFRRSIAAFWRHVNGRKAVPEAKPESQDGQPPA